MFIHLYIISVAHLQKKNIKSAENFPVNFYYAFLFDQKFPIIVMLNTYNLLKAVLAQLGRA